MGKWADADYRAAYQREYRRRNRERLEEQRAARYAAQREEMIKKAVEYQRAHPEKARARRRRWVEDNPDKHREVQREYRRRNADVIRAKNARYQRAHPEKGRANAKEYARRHPEWKRQCDVVYHARRRNAPGRGITRQQWADILRESGGYCTYCGHHGRMTLDHVQPLVRGGANDIDNAVVACRTCNSSKNDSPLLLWLFTRAAA